MLLGQRLRNQLIDSSKSLDIASCPVTCNLPPLFPRWLSAPIAASICEEDLLCGGFTYRGALTHAGLYQVGGQLGVLQCELTGSCLDLLLPLCG